MKVIMIHPSLETLIINEGSCSNGLNNIDGNVKEWVLNPIGEEKVEIFKLWEEKIFIMNHHILLIIITVHHHLIDQLV